MEDVFLSGKMKLNELNALAYISCLCRDDAFVDIESGSNFTANRAIGSPWECGIDQCSGGAISSYGTSRLYVRNRNLFERNRQANFLKARKRKIVIFFYFLPTYFLGLVIG
jgi:hypothetical protein